MHRVSRRQWLGIATTFPWWSSWWSPYARASTWPHAPVKIIVPFAPGGGGDVIARLVAPAMSAHWKQPVLIDNRAGASGLIGADAVAKSKPDGFTLLLSNNASIATAPLVVGNAGFHPLRDFAHAAMLGGFANALLVRNDHPAKTLADFVAQVRAKPGAVNYSSAGNGSAGHLTGELFKLKAGVDMRHIPYKGTGPALIDLMAGQIDALFDGLPASLGYMRAGKLRAIAVTSEKRSPLFPGLPALQEMAAGVIGGAWFGLSAPAGTPAPIIGAIELALRVALNQPEVKSRFAEMGVDLSPKNAADYTAHIEAEIARWAPVIRDARVRGD
ncbi:MAG: tripartite tricarboxylate transporter substrate binding protein [Betaproteobacteria bacterium]|nr:tripartite tricarboxylate transporter substrate binding protein [Betaproteobacteria bacterium]